MNIFFWIGIGLLAGGLASRILDDKIEDSILDVVLGVGGSVFSGFLLSTFGTHQSGVDLFQVLILMLSSTLFIWVRNNIRTQ